MSDQIPIGTPPIDACSPCQSGLTEETALGQMRQILDKLCALDARVSNWELILGRARNRLAALERKPTPQQARQRVSMDLCSSEESAIVEALAACVDGGPGKFTLARCKVPMGNPDGNVKAESIDPTYLDNLVVLRAFSTYTNSATYSFPLGAYTRPDCANHAIISFEFGIGATSGGSATGSLSYEFKSGKNAIAASVSTEASASMRQGGVVVVPIIGGQITFKTTKAGSVGSGKLGINLIGFRP